MDKKIKNMIDFVVIGAQKAGTTSLFKYLSIHPDIYIPPEKELAFFSNDEKFKRGIEWYIKTYFDSADPSKLWGDVSPQYMIYSDVVPERMYNIAPSLKIIAILRNPLDRAFSHYRMAIRRGWEKRDFETYVRQLIERSETVPDEFDEQKEYLILGEYGRILSQFIKYFPINQIKILFSVYLNSQPITCMEELFSFLGVGNFKSDIFNKKYHIGGFNRFSFLEGLFKFKWLARPITFIFKLFLSSEVYRSFPYWFKTQFIVKPMEVLGPSEEMRQLLVTYYRDDVTKFEHIFHIKIPWKEFDILLNKEKISDTSYEEKRFS